MIRLNTLLEKSVKADFLKAIGSHKPVVSYRVYADIGDDKVGITGWYTIAVIHDVIDDIKKRGVTILGIEKSTELKKMYKNVDGIKIENQINEDLVSGVIGVALMVGVKLLLPHIFDGLMNLATDIRNFVNPPKYIKFLKQLENNDEFNRQFIALVKERGGMEKFAARIYSNHHVALKKLPALKTALEKFYKEEGLSKNQSELLEWSILDSMKKAINTNWPKTLEMLKKKYPDLAKDMDESVNEMIATDKTDGRVKQMLKKMQSAYPSMNAINYNTQDKTYLFAFGKKSDAEKLEKDFSKAKSKKGAMKLIRSADYNNDKPPVFVRQYQILQEAWLKPASPLIEKTETIIRLSNILKEVEDTRNREMVTGVAEILRGVEDTTNRKDLAYQMMKKFEDEGVVYNAPEFLSMCGLGGMTDTNVRQSLPTNGTPAMTAEQLFKEADSPTERTRRYNRKNKKKVRAYLKSTQDDRVARNRDRAKAVKKHGKAKMKNHDVHHPNGPHNGGARLAKKDHGPDKKK